VKGIRKGMLRYGKNKKIQNERSAISNILRATSRQFDRRKSEKTGVEIKSFIILLIDSLINLKC